MSISSFLHGNLLLALTFLIGHTAFAQGAAEWTSAKPGSDNIEVLGHIRLGPLLSVADMDLEQELNRPYAYVSRMVFAYEGEKGTDIISIADRRTPR